MHRSLTEKEDGYCCVIGPASCGTRLLTRIVDAAKSWTVFHDSTHGEKLWDHVTKPIIILRQKRFAEKSAANHHRGGIPSYDQSLKWIEEKYPNALRIQYEDIIKDLPGVIQEIASYLECPTWSFDEPIINANSKWE